MSETKDNKADGENSLYPTPIHGFAIMPTTPEENRWYQFQAKIESMTDKHLEKLLELLDNL